jgi:hypothetical protein
MKKFRIVPLTKEYVNRIRQTNSDDYGNELLDLVATGKGPCRISLKPFEIGKDHRLLFKHSPFEIDNAFNQPGPVFIKKEEVEPYSDIYNFPPEIKADKKYFPLSLLGYSKDQRMIFTRLVGDDDVDVLIGEIFDENPEIEYLHARNADACCFICKIERV